MTHPPESLRERKKRETYARILDAGRELFQSQGFEETAVEQIAAQANISRATFFNYFGTKEALLGAIADEELDWLQRRIEGELSAESSAVARIRQAVRLLVEDTWSFLQVTRYVFLDALRHPAGQDTCTALRMQCRCASNIRLSDILGTLVREAQETGEIRAGLDPDEIAQAIVGAYLAALFSQIATKEGKHSPTSKMVENIVDMLFEGIAKE